MIAQRADAQAYHARTDTVELKIVFRWGRHDEYADRIADARMDGKAIDFLSVRKCHSVTVRSMTRNFTAMDLANVTLGTGQNRCRWKRLAIHVLVRGP